MKLLILNGPNLNLLGVREPEIYGHETLQDLQNKISIWANENSTEVEFYQSNNEGALVDKIQEAYFQKTDAIVFNPGAYTHTSVALLDALKATKTPCVEVHISSPDKREKFRKISYIREACKKTIMGKGLNGYLEACEFLKEYLNK